MLIADFSSESVDFSVVAWGENKHGQTDVPPGLGGVKAIAAGYAHTALLRNNDTVAAWGGNWYGQTDVPPGLSGVKAIAAGWDHSVALKRNSTVAAWGSNKHRQTDVPRGLNGVTAIAAGEYHTAVLKADGTVTAWGSNKHGQTAVPQGLSGVTAISARGWHTVALKAEGAVAAWGNNEHGQTDVPPELTGVIAVAAGGYHTAVLKTDGTVAAWGSNQYGQTDVPDGLSGVTAIAAGSRHTVALKADGTIAAWGGNWEGQTDMPDGLTGVAAIAAGWSHTAALKTVSEGIVFAPGETSKTLQIDIQGDLEPEPDESFTVRLHSPSAGDRLAVAVAEGVIQDDDGYYRADIAVYAEGAPMPNGGRLDFGTVLLGSTAEWSLQVRNLGNIDLKDIRPAISGEQAADFEVVLLPMAGLSPDAAADLTVRFSPQGAGNRTAALQLFSNAPVKNPFTIALGGNGEINVQLMEVGIETQAPNFVTVGFRIIDSEGQGVNLPKALIKRPGFFKVLEDGVPLSSTESFLQTAKIDEVPSVIRTVLVLDNSFSVLSELPAIKTAAKRIIADALPDQEFVVYSFSSTTNLLQDFTGDTALLESAVDAIDIGQASTDLYGAIRTGLGHWTD